MNANTIDAYDLDELRGARISSVFDRLVGVAVVNIVNAGIMLVVVQRHGNVGPAFAWLGSVSTLSLVRLYFYRQYLRDESKLERGRYWERISVVGSLLSGLLWGFGAVALFADSPADQWLWSLAIGGMCAGAAALHAAHLPTALCFTIPACAPLAIFLAFQNTHQSLAAAAMIVAFILVTTFTVLLSSNQFGRAFLLNLTLERRTRELDLTNRRLTSEIEGHRTTAETLNQAQKMEALGNLTGGFAHDFNNLLTVIVGNVDLISRRSKDEHVAGLANSAIDAAQSGAQLISSLLAFSRKQTLAPQLVDINVVILDFRELLVHASGSSVRLGFELSEGAAMAVVDAAQLQAALLNLVINAKDAIAQQNGTIVISTSCRKLKKADLLGMDADPGRFVQIDVQDNGPGIAPEIASKVFEPFFTTKRVSGGSGLGLSQVYGFARQSGGFCRIASRPGEGACVSIFIPASDQAVPDSSDEPSASVSAVARPRNILIVDDNADVLVLLKEQLAIQGSAAMMAPDAEAAIGILERYPEVDMLIADFDLPLGITGLQLIKTAKSRWPGLPMILISGTPIAIEDLPPDVPFLSKPFLADDLLRKVESLPRRSEG